MHRTVTRERIIWSWISKELRLSKPDPTLHKYLELCEALDKCPCPAACQAAWGSTAPPSSRTVCGLSLQLPLSTCTTSILLGVGRLAQASLVSIWNHSCSSPDSKMALSGLRENISTQRCLEPSLRQSHCRCRAAPAKPSSQRACPSTLASFSCLPPTLQEAGRLLQWESCSGEKCNGSQEGP